MRRGFVGDGRRRFRTQPRIGEKDEQERTSDTEREISVQQGHDPAEGGCVAGKTSGCESPDQRSNGERTERREVTAEI